MYRTLASTADLANHLGDSSWVVVDCRYDLTDEHAGAGLYRTAHVPGAVYASLSHDLAGEKTGMNGRHPLPSPDAMTAVFSTLGIGSATQVVCYDADSGMFAARLWWMLRYMGHDAVAVLDGGFAKWTREGRQTRSGEDARPPVRFAGTARSGMRRLVTEVQAHLGDASALLIDARAAERYEGRSEPLDRIAGHIPGAVNHFFKRNVADDGTMLPPDQLRRQFAGVLGSTPPGQATMYCGSGVTACQNLLAMEHAGLPGASLYVGSWSEWSSDSGRPVETGPEKTSPAR